MGEKEVKILEIPLEATIRRLELLGAVKMYDGPMDIEYYDFPNERLNKENKTVRLRSKGEILELTYKKEISKKKIKDMDEHEITLPIDQMGTLRHMLTGIGLKVKRTYHKHRISYVLRTPHLGEAVHFEIDKYPKIPYFLEIEAATERIIEYYVKELGYVMKDAKPWSTKELFAYYKVR